MPDISENNVILHSVLLDYNHVKGEIPIYLGLCTDNFIYFPEDILVERTFESKLAPIFNFHFTGPPQHFLDLKMECNTNEHGKNIIFIYQQAFIEDLIIQLNLDDDVTGRKLSPYRSGYPIDKIPSRNDLLPSVKFKSQEILRHIVVFFNWLTMRTRPDITTITNLLV